MEGLLEKQDRTSGHIIRAFENLKRQGQANITFGVVEARIQLLDTKWDAFVEMHEQIEETATAEDKKGPYFTKDVYTLTEDGYALSKGKFLDLVRRFKGQDEPTVKAPSVSQQLPKLNLSKFSGDFSDWQTFRDLFASMVGDNASLTPIEKMQYLKTSLTGEPAAVIASLPVAAESLETAWVRLKDRYENVRLLTLAQLSRIFALQSMKSESSAELKTLYNGTVNAVAALRALGRPVDGYDDFVVYLTVRKLDQQSRREWEALEGAKKTPSTFAELRTFLEARICSIQALEPTSSSAAPKDSGSLSSQGKGNRKSGSSNNRVKSHQASSAPAAGKRCTLCKQNHFIVFSEALRSKSSDERRAFVLANNLCLNCLGRHFVRECQSQNTCREC